MAEYSEEALLELPGVSILQIKDEQLIRPFFSKDLCHYSGSWLYILRAAHCENGKLGYKFISQELVAVIGYRHNYLYITPIVDAAKGRKLQQLCQDISSITQVNIIVKKYSKDFYPNLDHQFLSEQSEYCVFEDDSFPERILVLDKLFVSQQADINPKAKKFLRKIKRFQKLNIQYHIIEDIALISQNSIFDFLKKDNKKYDSFYSIVKYLYEHGKDNRYKIMVFLRDTVVEGLYIAEYLSPTEAGLYCAVTSKNKPGITEWIDYYFLRELFYNGIKIVYIGGSDNKGVEHYVEKLLPSFPDYNVEAKIYLNSKVNDI